MTDPTSRSALPSGAGVLDLLRAFAHDETTADRYAEEMFNRATTIEPALKAFEYRPVQLAPRRPGPLSGIPVAVKDIIATSDMPTTNGSAIYRDHLPAADAWVVERLRNLGATIFGKTITTEFAWRHPGPTVNPWNPEHTPGGSSSGSAAAVAAGIVPLALGSQTLGSVIRPAAFNGVVGFKPSYGAIPRVGIHPLSPSLDHVGFFARRVDDVAFALSLLAGSSDADRHGRPVPAFHVATDTGLAPLSAPLLAVVRFDKWSRAEVEQQRTFDAAIAKLRAAGAVLHEADFATLDRTAGDTINTILICEATAIFAELVERFPDRTSDRLKEFVAGGRTRSAYDYLIARKQQEILRADFAAQISGYDAVLTLPAFGEAPRGLSYTGDADYCAPWTLLGAPALSLPAGLGKNRLPLGVQVVGAYREDFKTLRVAKWVEQVLACDIGKPELSVA